MDLKPLILSLALIPAFAQAEPACGAYCPQPPSGFTAEQAFGSAPPTEYGTRTDIYLMDDGEIQIQKHMANDEDDEVRVYDYDYDADYYDE